MAGAVGRVGTVSCEPLARQGGSARSPAVRGASPSTPASPAVAVPPPPAPPREWRRCGRGPCPTQPCSTSAGLSSSLMGATELALSLSAMQCHVVISHVRDVSPSSPLPSPSYSPVPVALGGSSQTLGTHAHHPPGAPLVASLAILVLPDPARHTVKSEMIHP